MCRWPVRGGTSTPPDFLSAVCLCASAFVFWYTFTLTVFLLWCCISSLVFCMWYILHESKLYFRKTTSDKTTSQQKTCFRIIQWPILIEIDLWTKTTSQQRPPLNKDHISTKTTSQQRPHLNKDHLSTKTTSQQRPHLAYTLGASF